MLNFLNRLLEPKTNGPEIAHLLLRSLNVRVSESTLRDEIEGHPNYPSLMSISDTLTGLKVDNIAARFSSDKIDSIPTPFITQIRGSRDSRNFFTVVKVVQDDLVSFLDPEKHVWVSHCKDDFIKRYNGFVLIAEPHAEAGEAQYAQKIARERKQRAL